MGTVPELVFRSAMPDDEHAFCPCGALMTFNADTGQLECDDCLTDAEVAP
ncbi:hypothetical protein AB0F72_08735 [Actinoplanes sp. NPDC023936]